MAKYAFEPARDIPSLKGKVILVTGGNAGIGKGTIRALAAHDPAKIYLCARRREAGMAAAAELKDETHYAGITVFDLDLASLESVKKCAAAFTSAETRLDILFLNAGIASTAPALTKEGYEAQFGVNHVGHALLTQLLLPMLLETQRSGGDVRVVATASNIAMSPMLPKGGLDLSAMRQPGALSPIALYANSKLANVLFSRKLAVLYPTLSVTAIHPGVVKSDIWGKGAGGLMSMIMRPFIMYQWVDIDEGAKSQLWCATAPRAKGGAAAAAATATGGVHSGTYYTPVGKIKEYSGPSADQALVDELWTWTTDELAKHGGPGWVSA